MNHNVYHLSGLGDNLTEEDRAAFYVAGLPLPQFAHGPRDCTADYYADDDRRDAKRVSMSARMKAQPLDRAGANGERETSAGLTHAQRVMRSIRIVHRREDELEPETVY